MKELVLIALSLYQQEVSDAFRHATQLPQEQALNTVYVSFAQIPEDKRALFKTVIDFHFNSLSVKPMIHYGVRVTPTLYAYDLFRYGIDPAIWDRLEERNVYFQSFSKKIKWPGGKDVNGDYFEPGVYDKEKRSVRTYINEKEFELLKVATGRKAPIVRADFLLHETAIQFNRNGHGYYDLLKLKSRDDYLKLVGTKLGNLSKKAIVRRSGVADLPRQVEIIGGEHGLTYRTLDALKDDREERNAIENLDVDYKHEAEEWYGRLPNKLFAYLACTADGTLQDYAPPEIGGDKTTKSNDYRIHAGLSCIRCHIEGIRPVDNLLPKLYTGKIRLNTNDLNLSERLTTTYLFDFNRTIKLDQAAYADDIKTFFKLTPKEIANAYAEMWNLYSTVDLLPADMAREFGVTELEYMAALKIAYKINKFNSNSLAGHLQTPPIPITRAQAEQLIPLIDEILQLTR